MIIVYIDNIILFTKETFDHHVDRLSKVLEVLQENNLHVHVEETFLANKKVDYLGSWIYPYYRRYSSSAQENSTNPSLH